MKITPNKNSWRLFFEYVEEKSKELIDISLDL